MKLNHFEKYRSYFISIDELPSLMDSVDFQFEEQYDLNHAIIRLALILDVSNLPQISALMSHFAEFVVVESYSAIYSHFLQDLFQYLLTTNSNTESVAHTNLITSGLYLFDQCIPGLHSAFISSIFSPEILTHFLRATESLPLPENFPEEALVHYGQVLDEIDFESLSSDLKAIFLSLNSRFPVSLISLTNKSERAKSSSSLFTPLSDSAIRTELSVRHIRSLLQFLVLSRCQERLSQMSSMYRPYYDPTVLSKIFLLGSDIFLDPEINRCLSVLFESSIIKFQELNDFSPEFPLYLNLVEMFCSDSYGDALFLRVLVYFIRQQFPAIHRSIFWSEISQIIAVTQFNSITNPPVDERGFLVPKEKDPQVLNLLRDIVEKFPDDGSFIFKIARAHCS